MEKKFWSWFYKGLPFQQEPSKVTRKSKNPRLFGSCFLVKWISKHSVMKASSTPMSYMCGKLQEYKMWEVSWGCLLQWPLTVNIRGTNIRFMVTIVLSWPQCHPRELWGTGKRRVLFLRQMQVKITMSCDFRAIRMAKFSSQVTVVRVENQKRGLSCLACGNANWNNYSRKQFAILHKVNMHIIWTQQPHFYVCTQARFLYLWVGRV